MDSLLDALQEGRLIELPDNNRDDALHLLAHILEAIPSVPPGTDVVGLVMERERVSSTVLGKGWACPHARVPFEEDLVCVVGWSPTGIDYGSSDGTPISVIAMYLVPSNQRNHYLREISLLAKALDAYAVPDKLRSTKDLNDVRNYLLDLIGSTKDTVGPDARARMIQLQGKQSIQALAAPDLSSLIVEPFTVVAGPGLKPVVLTQNAGLGEFLDGAAGLIDRLESDGAFQDGAWRLVKRSTLAYQGGRVVYDCLAIKLQGGSASSPK
ncbi:MAG: PTS sugar transporter subunit IIA [Gemmatimonadales bacterium]|jgi:mannitol/fructose-specific phosphotransferase system IIA component (Ntr-type)